MIVLSFPLSLFSLLFGILFPLLGSFLQEKFRYFLFFKILKMQWVVRQDATHSIH